LLPYEFHDFLDAEVDDEPEELPVELVVDAWGFHGLKGFEVSGAIGLLPKAL
jgi:hypothetical protein